MNYVAHASLPPSAVFQRLRSWKDPGSWYVPSPAAGRLYAYVTEPSFQVSMTAGHAIFGAVGTGNAAPDGSGTRIELSFTFGIAGPRFPSAVLRLSAGLSAALAALLLYSDSALVVLSLAPVLGGALYRWWKVQEVRDILQRLSSSLEGADWQPVDRVAAA